jgi:hypothetical protein
MNLNPDHKSFQDKVADKYTVLTSVLNLPDSHKEKWHLLADKISEQLLEFDTTDGIDGKIPPMPEKLYEGIDQHVADSLEDIVRYMAFQELQIHNLQEEMRVLYEGLDQFARVIDAKQDKPNPQLN